MTATRTMDASAPPTTLKERNLARLHHAANGAAAGADAIVVGGAVGAVAVAVGAVAVGAVGAGGAVGAVGACAVGAVGGGLGAIVGAIVVGSTGAAGAATRTYKHKIPERKQAFYQRIGAASIIIFSLAAGGITGKFVYDKAEDDLRNQKTSDVASAPTPLAQQFSISNSGEGPCVVVFPKKENPQVTGGDCKVELK